MIMGKQEGGTPNTSVLGLSVAITPNHKQATYKSVSAWKGGLEKMFPDRGVLT